MGATTFTLRYGDLLAATRAGAATRGRWRRGALIALPWATLAVALGTGDLAGSEPLSVEVALVLAALGWSAAMLLVAPIAARQRLVRRVRRRFAREPETALLTTLAWRESGLVLASPRGTVRLGWDEVSAVEQGALLLFRRHDGGVPPFVPLALLTPAQRAELLALADGVE
ncbi:hypothetical protein K7957_14790 [Sphingomonas yunnanensis]|uniref:hypothetical protein n=1 Tax=Sphingomonas yunnanensis TaxID=310400 RepID=UPI001CA6F4B4|nr:hypothetical protein [Sphingomonas yunnanensis]MBY9064206.1 hypothetical protein [Sphingomonas yunnanensis]